MALSSVLEVTKDFIKIILLFSVFLFFFLTGYNPHTIPEFQGESENGCSDTWFLSLIYGAYRVTEKIKITK